MEYDEVTDSESLSLRLGSFKPQEWLDDLKDLIPHGPDGDKAYVMIDGKAHPYVSLAWTPSGNHIKREGEGSVDFESPALAWQMFICAFDRYKKGRNGKIYWRMRPEIIERVYSPRFKAYAVYARLYIAEV